MINESPIATLTKAVTLNNSEFLLHQSIQLSTKMEDTQVGIYLFFAIQSLHTVEYSHKYKYNLNKSEHLIRRSRHDTSPIICRNYPVIPSHY